MSDPQGQSMLDALRSDHRAIAAELADPGAVAADEAAHARRAQLVMDLVRHVTAEEQYLYPTVRTAVPDATEAAETGEHADRELETRLRALEDPDLTEAALVAAWADLRTRFAEHETRQESLFAALEAAVPSARLDELGADVLGAEQLAPTRPRSFVPSSPTANKFLSFVEGFLDRARDTYRHRGVDPSTADD